METKNQMLKILPFNSLNFSDSSVSFSSKSESYKFFPSKQIFGIWAWAVGTGGLLMGLIMWSNVPPIIPKCYTKKWFDFQKIHFYILPVSYFRLMLMINPVFYNSIKNRLSYVTLQRNHSYQLTSLHTTWKLMCTLHIKEYYILRYLYEKYNISSDNS